MEDFRIKINTKINKNILGVTFGKEKEEEESKEKEEKIRNNSGIYSILIRFNLKAGIVTGRLN